MGRLRGGCRHSTDPRVFLGEKFRMRIFNGVRFRAWFLSLLVCGLWQSYATAGIITFGSSGNTFDMTFVDIGNAGNVADTTGQPNSAGAVSYSYGIGKYEVSRDMINKYNSDYGTSNNLEISLFDLESNPFANIPGGNDKDNPATGVSWNEAARFTNWLNTSTGGSAAYNFTTNGVNDNIALWSAGDAGYNASNPFRNSRAKYVLPSMDEWYKAAYYDPQANGGAGGYSDFPNGLDTAPTAVASGTGVNTAVYGQLLGQGPAKVHLAGGASPYGVVGLGGNATEWQESAYDGANNDSSESRVIRGGRWDRPAGNMKSLFNSNTFGNQPTADSGQVGFRVASVSSSAASVPEPGTFGVLSLVGLALVAYRKRMKK